MPWYGTWVWRSIRSSPQPGKRKKKNLVFHLDCFINTTCSVVAVTPVLMQKGGWCRNLPLRLAGEQDLLWAAGLAHAALRVCWTLCLPSENKLAMSTLFKDLSSMLLPSLAFIFSVPLATWPPSSYSSLYFQDQMLKINFASRPN